MTEPRVLIVISSANRRGAELEGTELAQQLALRGMPVSTIALSPSASGTSVGAEVIGERPLSLATLRALRSRSKSFDVVVAYGASTLPACAIGLFGLRVPFVYRSIGDPARWVRGTAHRVRTAMLFHRARRVVALWPEAATSIRELYRLSATKVFVIPNARDAERFMPPTEPQRAAARLALDLQPAVKVAVFIGALSKEKRPLLAVEAATRVDGLRLLVAGDGPLRDEVEAAATAANGRVQLLGSVTDVVPLLHAADVVLSTSATEGMPGSLIEAVLCGVPVVATDVGAVASVVGGSPGVVVPSDASSTVIAEAIQEALALKAVAPIDTSFTWQAVVPAWQELLRAVARR
jgi:glycosyltransferase involved in cell wall biosynthesis